MIAFESPSKPHPLPSVIPTTISLVKLAENKRLAEVHSTTFCYKFQYKQENQALWWQYSALITSLLLNVLKDKNGIQQEFSVYVFLTYLSIGKWMEIIYYHKPFSKNYNKPVDRFLFLLAVLSYR